MKGYKVTDSNRLRLFGVACSSLKDLRSKGAAKLGISGEFHIALDDGTIVDDEDYFRLIPAQTILIFYRGSESVETGADYILNLLRRINSGYLTAGAMAIDFMSRKDLTGMLKEAEVKEELWRKNTREEDPDWFADLETNAKTKEEYMHRKAQDRIRGYFYKFRCDARRSPVYGKLHRDLNACLDYFRKKLERDRYFGCFFDRRCAFARKKRRRAEDAYDLKSFCDQDGMFACQGRWSTQACEMRWKHVINPYSTREARILFSTWNLDHRIEKSRTVLPTLLQALENRSQDQIINYEYFYQLLFTNYNLKLVHVVCHDKSLHDVHCDMSLVYTGKVEKVS